MHILPKILGGRKSLLRCSGGALTFVLLLHIFKWHRWLSQSSQLSPEHGCGGDTEKFWGDMAYLLIAPEKTIKGEMAFRLAVVWVHPYQACLCSLDEVAKKLTLLINLGKNWVYAFVWLNGDTQHVPLSREGHLSTMIDGMPSKSTCGHLHQLEVCKLLQYGDQVVYPEGLNGSLEPVQTLLSGLLLQVRDALGGSAHEPSFLLVDLSWVTPEDHMPKAWAPHRTSTPSSPSHLAMEHPPKTDSHISMTAEVQDLLSCAILDTSSQESGDSTPKRPTSIALEARMEDSSKLVATFPQVSPWVALPDDTKPIGHSSPMTLVLEASGVASIPATLPSKTSTGDDIGTLPKEVLHLQGEMNRIMGWLLTTGASMDAHWRKEVSNFQSALHQNEVWTTEIIGEAEAVYATAIREAKAHCGYIIQDTEATCTRTIREAETASTEHAHTLQQAHRDSMEGLEREAIEEEEWDHQSFLIICGAALQICSLGTHRVLMYPLQLLTGNMSLATLLTIPPQVSITREEPTLVISHPATPLAPVASSGMK